MARDRFALGQDRHRSVVPMQALGCQDVGFDQCMQRLKGQGAGADLVSQRRYAEIDALPGVALTLPVQARTYGSLEPAPQGRPPGTGKLALYSDFLIERVKEKPDIAMPELAAELETHYGIEADPALLSAILHALLW